MKEVPFLPTLFLIHVVDFMQEARAAPPDLPEEQKKEPAQEPKPKFELFRRGAGNPPAQQPAPPPGWESLAEPVKADITPPVGLKKKTKGKPRQQTQSENEPQGPHVENETAPGKLAGSADTEKPKGIRPPPGLSTN
jgi:hypothetical protein